MANVVLFSRVLDAGLAALDTEATHIYVCYAAPNSFATATTDYPGGNALGSKSFGAGAVFASPAAGSPNGRQVTSNAVTGGSITAAGTVAYWAVTDNTNSRLLAYGPVTGGTAVTIGQSFTLDAFTIKMPASDVVPASTWNPADKGSDLTLSNGDLDVTKLNSASGPTTVRATRSLNSGKRFFEIENTNYHSFVTWGLATSAGSLENELGSLGGNSAGLRSQGNYHVEGIFAQPNGNAPSAGVNGDRMQIAVDFDAGKAWLGVNNNAQASVIGAYPLFGTLPDFTFTAGTTLFPAVSLYGVGAGDIAVRLRSATNGISAPPPGFLWWDDPASPWSPLDLSNLVAWYCADLRTYSDAGTTPVDNGTLEQWNDLSGNGYHLTEQNIGVGRNEKNGLHAVNFGGGQSLYTTGNPIALGGQVVSVFVVVKVEGTNGALGRILSMANGTDDTVAGAFAIYENNSLTDIRTYNNGAKGALTISSGSWNVIGTVFDATNNTMYLNNAAGTPVGATPTFSSTVNLSLGSPPGGGGPFSDARIGEIIITKSDLKANATERNKLHTYLNRWNI